MITDMLTKIKDLRYNLAASAYPGYRMTEKSRAAWDRIEADKAKMAREWAERDAQMQREKVVRKARQLIEWSYMEYESAKQKHKANMRTFTELTLHWSPQRVMTKHRDFKGLCRALEDEKTWRMLSRKERAFVADAAGMK